MNPPKIETANFEDARTTCLQASQDPAATIPRDARQALLASLGPMTLKPKNRAEITLGLLRRVRLQVLCAQKVLPVWETIVGTSDPRSLLTMVDRYLEGTVSWEEAWRASSSLNGGLLNVDSIAPENIHVIYAGYAVTDAVDTALKDTDLDRDGVEDRQMDSWDGPLYACGAYSGEMPWMPRSDARRRLEFWRWWLEQATIIFHAPTDGGWASLRDVGSIGRSE